MYKTPTTKPEKFYYNSQINWLDVILLLATFGVLIVKFIFLIKPTGPTIFGDELMYRDDAQRLFKGMVFSTAHYPPLYPIFLAPAFFFDNWYDLMKIINGVLSSLLIIPLWFIARKFISPTTSAFTVLLAALLPFQAIYPNFILAENLYLPLFLIAVFLTLEGIQNSKKQAFIFGSVLAGCFLTKYIFLPMIPVFVLFWLFTNKLDGSIGLRHFDKRDKLNVFCMMIGILTAFIPWVIFVHLSGLPLVQGFGYGISGIKINEISFLFLGKWAVAYLAYIVLLSAPILVPLLCYFPSQIRQTIKRKIISKEAAFFTLVFTTAVINWFVAIQHSFGQPYNYPIPNYLIGRYFMPLTPLIYISGILAIRQILIANLAITMKKILKVIGLSIGLVYIARSLLYDNRILGVSMWFANIIFNSPDSFVYKIFEILIFSLICMICLGFLIFYLTKIKNGSIRKIILFFLFVLILLWQSTIFGVALDRINNNNFGLHGRYLAQIINLNPGSITGNEDIYFGIPELSSPTLYNMFRFWGIDIQKEKLHKIDPENPETIPQIQKKPFLIITNEVYNVPPLGSYQVGEINYYVYQQMNKNGLAIIDYQSLDSIIAGKPFNVQPGGDSAFFLSTKNCTHTTVVMFSDHELNTSVVSPDEVIALLPNQYFLYPGKVKVYLLDKLTGEKSGMIEITVH